MRLCWGALMALVCCQAQAADLVGVSVHAHNDVFAGQDANLTNALTIQWAMRPDQEHHAVLDFLAGADAQLVVIELGQDIYTPVDHTPQVLPRDRAYVGRLGGAVLVHGEHGSTDTTTRLSLGVVGPGSFAEDIQNAWHDGFGAERFRGWEHQIGHGWAWMVAHERTLQGWATPSGRGMLRPTVGVTMGNWQRGAHAAVEGQWHLGPTVAWVHHDGRTFAQARPEGISLFTRVGGQYVNHDATLGRGENGAAADIEAERGVGLVVVGARWTGKEWAVEWSRTWSSRQFDVQERSPEWGQLTVAKSL